MTIAAEREPASSPWLSIWFRPGDTIAGVLAAKPAHLFLWLLVAGALAERAILAMADGGSIPLLDWRFLAVGAIAAVALGGLGLYLGAFLTIWSGRLFGGRASFTQMCAVVAWGVAPVSAAFVISLAVILAGGATGKTPAAAVIALKGIGLVAGVWSAAATIAMLRRVQHFGWARAIFYYATIIVLSFALALLIRALLFQPFYIPSGSMKPTFLVGDDLFVSKYAYGYSRFSLPFSPPLFTELTGRLFGAEPQRGDVAVYRLPRDPGTNYVSRIVGLPGDRIQMKGGVLHINGTPVQRERIDDFIDDDNDGEKVRRWRETLPNGVSHETLDLQDNGSLDNTDEYAVPAGHYFMMGDNRDNATDSRVPRERLGVGYVPFDNLVGRAAMVHFSVNRAAGRPAMLRLDRLGRLVR